MKYTVIVSDQEPYETSFYLHRIHVMAESPDEAITKAVDLVRKDNGDNHVRAEMTFEGHIGEATHDKPDKVRPSPRTTDEARALVAAGTWTEDDFNEWYDAHFD